MNSGNPINGDSVKMHPYGSSLDKARVFDWRSV
jgi:hypothetical protein